ncbi:hypothetical protein [Pontibacter fetidus]|uniref:Uncharacterized protein n=1 Tax=Pontibacter fetidus TaxID=2700082 RepID=A0A6B2HCT8_9BACT|nr:hypothetical protein [Pontibacter fetidus]NDK57694.1 hypothetical protein [Pontibacter fetidus]
MDIRIIRNTSVENVADHLRSFDIIGIVKYNHSTSGFEFITIKDGSKALSFDLNGNIRIGNNNSENGFAIKIEEAK